jgi:hypothetical protein
MHQLCFIDNKTTFANKDKTIGGSLLQATSCTKGALLLQARRLCSSDVKGLFWFGLFSFLSVIENHCLVPTDASMSVTVGWVTNWTNGLDEVDLEVKDFNTYRSRHVFYLHSKYIACLHVVPMARTGRSSKLHFQKHCTLCLPTKKTNKTTTIPNVISKCARFAQVTGVKKTTRTVSHT